LDYEVLEVDIWDAGPGDHILPRSGGVV
jgi:hypothetical protein